MTLGTTPLGTFLLGGGSGATPPTTKMASCMDGLAGLIRAVAPATGNVFAWPVESLT